MIEQWRELLYPLGFLSSVAFGARILIQWLKSEATGKSVTPSIFWVLSLCGNILLMLHSLIQAQYHVYIIQVCNAVISWRNLNLLQPPESRTSTRNTIFILLGSVFSMTLLYLPINGSLWFRIPSLSETSIHSFWHVLGFAGLILFASRFWIQWWNAEQKQSSHLGPFFWWASLIGDLLTLLYFFRIKDSVNLIGPVLGLIPYVRNLVLLYRSQPIKGAL